MFQGCNKNLKSISRKASKSSNVDFWLSDESKSIVFAKQSVDVDTGKTKTTHFENIDVDIDQTFQNMDGFGFALNGGSALNIYRMSPSSRMILLEELFGNTNNSIKAVSYTHLTLPTILLV